LESSYLSTSINHTVEKMAQKNEQIKTLKKFQRELQSFPQGPKRSPVIDRGRLSQVRILRGLQEINNDNINNPNTATL